MKTLYPKLGQWLGMLAVLFSTTQVIAQNPSVARIWNEAQIQAIRRDFARPPIQARNLFHVSAVMYDAWAAYEPNAQTYFLGNTHDMYTFQFNGVPVPADKKAAQEEAISYAAYRMMKHRYAGSPNAAITMPMLDSIMLALEYDPNYTSTNYANGMPAALGNYIASQVIAWGLIDGSNEQINYTNVFYQPVNQAMSPVVPGNPTISNPNRWQPLAFSVFIDQNGNVILGSVPAFQSPEWGRVYPFALPDSVKSIFTRGGNQYPVYHNPGPPPLLDVSSFGGTTDDYRWGFELVAAWSSHLDPADSVIWDISPASIGNTLALPDSLDDYRTFYDFENGGVTNAPGYTVNPKTGLPYTPQMVRRGDYTRVLAEFWADGPNSETPPGHWFAVWNKVNNNPLLERRWMGQGPELEQLEWDVKSYFTLGAGMHDAAITAWGIKGWYDHVRPISAIRYMSDRGQCTDPALPRYHPLGVNLIPGFIEMVQFGDPLAGNNNQNVNKIKVKAWRGPSYIFNAATDVAGVDWILMENWWPYQRPTFVSPPFGGYISGHSTYSRTAAEVLTAITGDPFFPGGMGEFLCPRNQYLVFEDGPSDTIRLQWATYRDASDQCSLSRIWGGIHPPCDDIPGRKIGIMVANDVVNKVNELVDANQKPDLISLSTSLDTIIGANAGVGTFLVTLVYERNLDTSVVPNISFPTENPLAQTLVLNPSQSQWISAYTYQAAYDVLASSNEMLLDIDIQVTGGMDADSMVQDTFTKLDAFDILTNKPLVTSVVANTYELADAQVGSHAFVLNIFYNEDMDTTIMPSVFFTGANPLARSLELDSANCVWILPNVFVITYSLKDSSETLLNIGFDVDGGRNMLGNAQVPFDTTGFFSIDTENPEVLSITVNLDTIRLQHVGTASFELLITYSEAMDEADLIQCSFPVEDPLASVLVFNPDSSAWVDDFSFKARYDVIYQIDTLDAIDVAAAGGADWFGNAATGLSVTDLFSIRMVDTLVSNEHLAFSQLRMFPNPVPRDASFQLRFDALTGQTDINMFDINGRLVYNNIMQVGSTGLQVPTTGLSAGVYLVKISDSQQIKTLRLVVE